MSRWAAPLALLAGALITLSLAPYGIWPAAILSCAVLLHLLQNCTPRQALWRGWLFGLGMFGSGVSWVYVSIHVYGQASVPLAAALTAAFCAGLALLPMCFSYCYVRWVRPLPAATSLGFAALWLLFEWLRSWFLTGFPWLFLGYAHIDNWLAGWAPITGIYGLSFATALSAACLYSLLRQPQHWLRYGAVLLLLWGGGKMLQTLQWVQPSEEPALSVALLQPNIPLEEKWDRAFLPQILAQFQAASADVDKYDLVLWPESAIPGFYQRMRLFLDPIAERASRAGSALISGIPYRAEGEQHYYNSIVALGNGQGVYHKQRLVPFGEYVPLEAQLRGLIHFFDLPMSAFSAGSPSQGNLLAQGKQLAPFICYEIVYPDLVRRGAHSADLMLTISNDSWFGDSIGPLQHLQMARMRALENGRYLLRGTNNGVSAIIAPDGKVLARSEQFVATTLSGSVQLMRGHTLFSKVGSTPSIVGSALVLLGLALLQRRRRQGGRRSPKGPAAE